MATMLDIAKLNGNRPDLAIIEEGVGTYPEIANFPVYRLKGVSYTAARRVGRPAVGFRSPNMGASASESRYEKDLHQLSLLGGRIVIDKAVADADEKGPRNLQALETVGVGQSILEKISKQVWRGTENEDSDGFLGLNELATEDYSVVAGGETESGEYTSAYLVRYGVQDGVSFDMGANALFALSPFRTETAYDADNKAFPAYVADLCAWIGLSLKSTKAVMRIANISPRDNAAGISDAIIAKALAKWEGKAPDALYMNRNARYLLQASRSVSVLAGPTARLAANIDAFAPLPTESNGIPIVCTDGIGTDEYLDT